MAASPSAAELFDRLASFGERFSASSSPPLLKGQASGRARHVLGVRPHCDTFRDAQPHLEQTKQRGREVLLPLLEAGVVPVVTGFIGRHSRRTQSPRSAATAPIFSGGHHRPRSGTPTNSSSGPTVDAVYTANPANPPKRSSSTSSATTKPTPSPPAAPKSSTPKFCLSRRETEMSSWFATRSIHKRAARASARGVLPEMRSRPSQNSVSHFSIAASRRRCVVSSPSQTTEIKTCRAKRPEKSGRQEFLAPRRPSASASCKCSAIIPGSTLRSRRLRAFLRQDLRGSGLLASRRADSRIRSRPRSVKGLDPSLDCDFVFSALDSSVAGPAEEDFARAGYPVSATPAITAWIPTSLFSFRK